MKPQKPKAPTVNEFLAEYPDEDACLAHLFRVRVGGDRLKCAKCGQEANYYRVKARRCFECEFCGFQIYPTAGTPFEKTRTSLRDWYHVMFLFCVSRNGISSKEVQRTIGVTYKTAWRMTREIRTYMGAVDGDLPLGGPTLGRGVAEIDKTFVGGKRTLDEPDNKTVVLGMIERGHDVMTRVVPSRHSKSVLPHIAENVKRGSRVATDQAKAFADLSAWGYYHETVDHSVAEWVRGDVHTNTIESFWSTFKRGLRGTYVWVSKKHLQKYLWEFEYRHNHRKQAHSMFDFLVASFAWACHAPSRKAAG